MNAVVARDECSSSTRVLGAPEPSEARASATAACLVLLLLLVPADLLAYAHVNMDQHGPREDRLHDQRLVPHRRMPPLPAAYHRSLSSMPLPTPYLPIPKYIPTYPLPAPYLTLSYSHRC